MKFLLVVAFATFAFVPTIARTLFEEKIIGGTTASEGQFPYLISLKYYDTHMCGGSIINQNTILTAAHCVNGYESRTLNILAGTNQLNFGGVSYIISRYVIHENWSSLKHVNDIAVIKINTPIELTKFVQPVPIDDRFISAGAKTVLSGWGYTSHPGTTPNDLLYFEGYIMDLDQCIAIFTGSNYPVLDSNICSFSSIGIGGCTGDSGGPLVSNNKQIGIASWVTPCAVGYPDVYTRVSSYADWIKRQ